MKRNLGLTKGEFDYLVDELKKGNEEIFEIVFKKMVDSAIKRLKNDYKNDDDNIEDAVMETLLIFRKRLKEGQITYGALNFLFYKILYREYSRIKKNGERYVSLNEEINFESKLDRSEGIYHKDQLYILRLAFGQLDKKCREVLEEIYTKQLLRTEISKQLGLTDSGLRKRKRKCLDKLKSILIKTEEFK